MSQADKKPERVLFSTTPCVTSGYMKETVQTSAKLDRALVQAVKDECKKRGEEIDDQFSYTAAIDQALRAWLSQMGAGAMFPSHRERGLVDGLRRLMRTEPGAVDAIFLLAENAIADPEGAKVLVGWGQWLRYWASRLPKLPRLAGAPGSGGSEEKGH